MIYWCIYECTNTHSLGCAGFSYYIYHSYREIYVWT